ncbi:DMT family transporter [Caldalkalibacillus mannanilyticus]|uniref:DMT family transporter n=1 Tax=Caldalkalibacillus mannanilyticus TaxID=1418 RepID=UPI0004688144|nr:EamA family transporter [Caldalkalibacillus mannanilyticus]
MIIINYLLVCLIFGTTFFAIKVGIEAGAPPLFSAGLRFFIAGLLVILFFAVQRKKWVFLFASKQVLFIGFCLTFMTFSTLYWAEQYITSGLAAVLSATGPMMILLIQSRREQQKVKLEQAIALLIGLVGVLLISLPGLQGGASYLWFFSCLLILFGEFFYGLGSVKSREVVKEYNQVSPFLINGVQMCVGGLMLLLVSFIVETPRLESFTSSGAIGSIVYLIIVGSIMGHGLYYWLISKTNPVFPSTWLYISPLIALVIGYVFLQEIIRIPTVVGAFLIIIGVVLANRETLHQLIQDNKLMKKELPL